MKTLYLNHTEFFEFFKGSDENKTIKFPTFWFDSTPQGKFMLNITFGQSKYYVDNLSENIRRGIRQKLRNGIWPAYCSFTSYLVPVATTALSCVRSVTSFEFVATL